jgi:phosphonate transport system substrate-binding protein
MKIGRLLTVLVFVVLIPLVFCGCDRDDETIVHVDMSKREDIKVPEPEPAITYAYLPQYSHTVSYQRHNPLIEYLARETGLPIRQVFPDTFEEHRRMVERGDIDISFSNPMTYIRIAQSGARAFARIIEPSGSPTFRGQIIIRKDNRLIRSLKDCKGKRWIAVDPLSAGGYLFALGLFLKHGITTNDFSEINFAPGPGGKQEKAVLAMYAGKYDLASIREGSLDIVKDKISMDKIRILATTQAYPGWVYAARKGLSPEIVEKISRAMFKLSMNDSTQARILSTAGMRGIIPAKDSDYDSIRDLAASLGMFRKNNSFREDSN